MAAAREAVWWRGGWNAALRGVTALGWQGTRIDVDHLLARACRETRLTDFGDMEFVEPLSIIVREFEAVAQADRTGHQVMAQIILASLANRLRINQALREQPQIADEPIVAPLFIVGLPRTGTTLLQGLLASLGHMRTPRRWETYLPPAPPAVATKRQIKAQVRFTEKEVDAATGLSPQLMAAHEIGAQLPEECNPLLMTSFRALFFGLLFECPEYREHVYRTGFAHSYEWHRRHLQVLSYGQPPKIWSLKSPVHLASLAGLLRTYPDARVVFTHRDPREAVASMAGLTSRLRMLVSPLQDKQEIGRHVLATLAQMEAAGERIRGQWPAHAPAFLDIRYRDLVRDPLATVRTVLSHFGLPEDDDLEPKIRRYLRENAQHRHGQHRYSLDEFALDEDEIRATFAREFERLADG